MGIKEESKSMVTPSMPSVVPTKEEQEELNAQDATKYRAITARGIYLAQDRTDIQYAVKELSRKMAKPTKGSWEKLKRLARYLLGRERMITKYKYQKWTGCINVWTDTDYAGCKETRRSTSGGIIQCGSHIVKSWSTTQNLVTLSSGESEYYGLVKGGAMALGSRGLMVDMGMKHRIRIRTDASAAKGIALRRGMGKVRHVEVSQLWLQEKVGRGEIEVIKIDGEDNIADALTKSVNGQKLEKHVRDTEQGVNQGRHRLSPVVDHR
jgi:hypothetical protein